MTEMNTIAVLSVCFMAQLFFSARVLVQWIMSERARRVLSPTLFWALSLAGLTCCACTDGCARTSPS